MQTLRTAFFGFLTRPILAAALVFLLIEITIPQAHAISLSIGDQIVNGSFTSDLSSWTASGETNRRYSTDNINQIRAGNDAFNGTFQSGGFAVLGDHSSFGEGTPDSGTHTLSQTFSLPAIFLGNPVDSYDLTVGFITAFQGSGGVVDNFSASLDAMTLFSQTSSAFPSCGPNNSSTCQHDPLVNNPFTALITGLQPGLYTLTFALVENSPPRGEPQNNDGNTFAGIDSVYVTGNANISTPPYVSEPMSVLLLGAGLLGLTFWHLKRASRR